MKKSAFVSLTIGSALAAAGMSPLAHANEDPFAAKPMPSGYQLAQADKGVEGKCGEAKCGADKKKSGSAAEKKAEGKCGEAKCGADKKKKEGKCGEAKCGADKK